MVDERTIKAALKADAHQMHLPNGLLERIHQQVESPPPARRAPRFRPRVGAKLELLAACGVLLAFLGIATWMNLNQSAASAGGAQGRLPDSAQAGNGGVQLSIEEVRTVTRLLAGPVGESYAADLSDPSDRELIDWLLAALAAAEPIAPTGADSDWPRARVGGLMIDLWDGRQFIIKQAVHCYSNSEDGLRCEGVPDKQLVTRSHSEESWVVSSPELERLLQNVDWPSQTQSIANLRQTVSFPIFVPTEVPDGYVQQTPQYRPPLVEIQYHTREGAQGLSVLNGPAGCCLDSDPRKAVGATHIRSAIMAYFLPNQPEFGGPILWWQEAGSYIALSGPYLTKDDLVSIAASLSAEAVSPGVVASAEQFLRETLTAQYTRPVLKDAEQTLTRAYRSSDAEAHRELTRILGKLAGDQAAMTERGAAYRDSQVRVRFRSLEVLGIDGYAVVEVLADWYWGYDGLPTESPTQVYNLHEIYLTRSRDGWQVTADRNLASTPRTGVKVDPLPWSD